MSRANDIPLCVDLDGTFIKSDLLHESLLRLLRHRPWMAFRLPFWLARGKTRLKSRLAAVLPDAATPPAQNEELVDFLKSEKESGRPVYLVTASHEAAVAKVSSAFPFDEVIASTDTLNLKGENKAAVLVERFGEKGFDYAGDSRADEAVWRRARKAIVVHRSARRIQQLKESFDVDRAFQPAGTTWRDWVKAFRVHQWAKNFLIAVPFLVGHHYHAAWQLAGLLTAFLSMSLCASGTYLWNDLLDLEYDRAHPRKRKRLAASGKSSIPRVGLASVIMVALGLASGFLLSPSFGLLLVGYIVATLSYSLHFKKVAIADIFMLAMLYLSRVIGGLLISEAVVSFWLFAFTFLLFVSLAAAKRFVELKSVVDSGAASIQGRGYRADDLSVVSQLGVAAGVASCIVLGLYSNSDQVTALYERPQWFWGICVVAFYWITRIWFITHRGEMHDDPVVFALKDPGTWILGVIGIACILFAQPIAAP
ncbi:UbiA family prenyltransferase [Luteolibacter flavescens]|uniref:UbiA family prenyltransferase n=1 Tax=Luteolibacter flavescens TaxID=1859460 RepID=A0ABT3FLK0_9BACT|nr:UbiA family prenyltransferase [Luteolibacter flavescens]MCW1884447.1 UbiA family prenyltransferase [Luteolibacter flavescens]